MSEGEVTARHVLVGVLILSGVPTLILLALHLTGVLTLAVWMIFLPVWIVWGLVFVLGHGITIFKYFRHGYWK
jgi:hypothetical protein